MLEDAQPAEETVTPESPRTPLTLEFAPTSTEETPHGIVVCEPSFELPGRVFLGVNPIGKRIGIHLLPDEAKRVRDHLTKLLLEPPDEGAADEPEAPSGSVNWDKRIAAAANRVKKRRKRRVLFRFEFQVGDIQGVIGRLRD